MIAAAMTVQRKAGRAHIEPGEQVFGARATTATAPSKATAETAVSTPVCGWDTETTGASQPALSPTLANRIGIAQQAARQNAVAMPPVTSPTAPVDLTPSRMAAAYIERGSPSSTFANHRSAKLWSVACN